MKDKIERIFKIYKVSNIAHFDGEEVNELLNEIKAELLTEVVNKNDLLQRVSNRRKLLNAFAERITDDDIDELLTQPERVIDRYLGVL